MFVLGGPRLPAQEASATLSGTVTDAAGKAAAHVKVSINEVKTGKATETETDAAGGYRVANLTAGDYEVSAASDGASVTAAKVTLAAGAEQTVNLAFTPATAANAPVPLENLPNAPSSSKSEPSLADLGFTPAESQGNAKEQALLDKRTHMLKIHQRMGLITTVPLVAAVVTSLKAGGKSESTATRDLHVGLGAAAGDLYFITAYYAIRAPRVQGTETRGPIKVHKVLAWIHGPGMILTPILGTLAFEQKSKGEHVHGLAAAHGPVAIVTAGAFGAALLSVSVKF
jgi:hypothetical protein